MRLKTHLSFAARMILGWFCFWLVGFPDYYQQYSDRFMIFIDLAVTPPIAYVGYRIIKKAKPGQRMKVAGWFAFHITVPLALYDYLYCGLYLGHGLSFLWRYWYLSVYYVVPWVLFPGIGLQLRNQGSLRSNDS